MAQRKLILIAGSGRTSSTLLALLLSQSAGCFNIGQIRDLYQGHHRDATCTCGAPVKSCPYWSAVCADAFDGDLMSTLRAHNDRFLELYRASAATSVWSDAGRRAELLGGFHDYLETTFKLYDSCFRIAGCSTLIDSSKSPQVALALETMPDVELLVLHLVRDPRAVVHSWHKSGKDRVFYTRLWKRRNRQLAAFAGSLGQRYKMVRYEDFATAPRATVDEIVTWAGVAPLSCFENDNTARVVWDDQHVFLANEAFLRSRSDVITVELRQDWRSQATLRTKLVASALSFPESVKFGYSVW